MKEDELQRCIVQYVQNYCPQWMLIHIPNQAIGKAGALRNNKAYYSQCMQKIGYVKGAPDLVLFNPTSLRQFLFLEVKSLKGRASESQKNFQHYCESKWGRDTTQAIYYIVRSVEEVQNILLRY
jgi:hypothetical protein